VDRAQVPACVVYDSKGNLHITDPPFGLPRGADDPGKELPYNGVHRLSPGGELALLIQDLKFPNGVAGGACAGH
jgi:gluconolactonase